MQHTAKSFPWYDSLWLMAYLTAKDFIRERHPRRLDDFVHAFDVFRTSPDFKVQSVPGLFEDEVVGRLRELIEKLDFRNADHWELVTFGRLVFRNQPYFDDLQATIIDRVSDLVGEPVEPCYNFLSLYKELGVCEVHMDAPFAKWTVDYCIEQSVSWPLFLSQVVPWPEDWESPTGDWQEAIKRDPAIRFEAHSMDEGDALIFSGSSQWHYRNAIQRKSCSSYCHLLFFHFIPQGTADLKVPGNWKTIFDIPELGGLNNPTGEAIFDF